MSRALWDTVGGRRFMLACSTQVVSSLLLWFSKLTPDAYSMIILGTVAAYIAGSSYQQVHEKRSE